MQEKKSFNISNLFSIQFLCSLTILCSGAIFFILVEKIFSDLYHERFSSFTRIDFFTIGLPLFLSSAFKTIGALTVLISKLKNLTIYFIGSFFMYVFAISVVLDEFLIPKYDCVPLDFRKEIVLISLVLFLTNTIFLFLYRRIKSSKCLS